MSILNPTRPFKLVNIWSALFTNTSYYVEDHGCWKPISDNYDFASMHIHDICQTGPESYKTRFSLSCTMHNPDENIRIHATSNYNDQNAYHTFKAATRQEAIEIALNIAHAHVARMNILLKEVKSVLVNEILFDKVEKDLETNGQAKITDEVTIVHDTKYSANRAIITIALTDDMTVTINYRLRDAALINVVLSMIKSTTELRDKILNFLNEVRDYPEFIMEEHPDIFGNTGYWYNKELDLADKYHVELDAEEEEYLNMLESCLQ